MVKINAAGFQKWTKITVAKKVMVIKEIGPDALGLLERKKRPLTGQKLIYLSRKSLSR